MTLIPEPEMTEEIRLTFREVRWVKEHASRLGLNLEVEYTSRMNTVYIRVFDLKGEQFAKIRLSDHGSGRGVVFTHQYIGTKLECWIGLLHFLEEISKKISR